MLQNLQEEPARSDFDPYTGEPEETKEDIASVVKIITQGEALAELTNTKGWPILIEFFESQVKYLTDRLKLEQDMVKIRYIQAEIKALESVPLMIEKVFVDTEEARRMVREFLTSEDPQG